MTEFDHDWKEPESYIDYPNGCTTSIIIIVFIFALLLILKAFI